MRVPVLSSALVISLATFQSPATAATTTCSIPTSCAVVQNTSTGPAIHAQSVSGFGIRSNSSSGGGIYASSGSGSFMSAGVEGESTNATANDAAGVFGLAGFAATTPPTYGVLGYGSKFGIAGVSDYGTTPGTGVLGEDISTGSISAGVFAYSIHGTGLVAESGASPSSNVYGSSAVGVYGVANNTDGVEGYGLFGESNGSAVYALNPSVNQYVCLSCGSTLIESYDSSGYFTVASNGSATLSGTLTTSKGTYVRTRGASGATRLSYGQRTTAPELEDVGEGQLVSGRALVRIDTALGDDIDRSRPYHVFVTPEGDSKGLYVSEKTPAGFVVREQQGGRSTLAFEYRIVAKPLDTSGDRLAMAPVAVEPKPPVKQRARPASRPLSPLEELRARIGPAAFAKQIREYERQRASP